MSEPIKVGDLGMQVQACCSLTAKDLGMIGTVQFIRHDRTSCRRCGVIYEGIHTALAHGANGGPIGWVRRIPPPEELGIVNEREELTA